MQVETYEVNEVQHDGRPAEDPSEALAIVEALGLEGQSKFYAEDAENGSVKTIPFRLLTEEENRVYSILMPKRVTLAKYADGMIPTRVLMVAALAKEMFDELRVWCPLDAREKDPILLGVERTGGFPAERLYLLARWGEELLPFDQLAEKASKVARDRVIGQLQRIVAEATAKLRGYEAIDADKFFGVHNGELPAFYDNGGIR